MTDEEYELVMQAAEAVHRKKMAYTARPYQVVTPPAVEVTNVVKTPEVTVQNNMPALSNYSNITVTTKELVAPLATAMKAGVIQSYGNLEAKLDQLIAVLTKLAERPDGRPKAMRLETGADGVRRAVPEY